MKRPAEMQPMVGAKRRRTQRSEETDGLWAEWAEALRERDASLGVRRRRSKKSVHFSEVSNFVALVPNAREYNAEERTAIWYSAREVAACRMECGLAVRRMRRGECLDSDDADADGARTFPDGRCHAEAKTTARGLERHASDAALMQRRRRKETNLRNVLREQEEQRLAGSDRCPEALREASMRASRESAELAREVGLRDERAVGTGWGRWDDWQRKASENVECSCCENGQHKLQAQCDYWQKDEHSPMLYWHDGSQEGSHFPHQYYQEEVREPEHLYGEAYHYQNQQRCPPAPTYSFEPQHTYEYYRGSYWHGGAGYGHRTQGLVGWG